MNVDSVTATLVGSDSEYMYVLVTSESESNRVYEIRFCKRSGAILCACPHATYKMLRPNVLELVRGIEQSMCKHVRLIGDEVRKDND